MIEIGLGALLMAAALAILFGAGGVLPGPAAFDPLPLLGLGGTAALLVLGAALVAAGLARRAIARRPARRRALRTARLTAVGCGAVALLAAGFPMLAEPLNLIRIEGIPAGYYLAAQGALVGLVLLAFAWSARQARIDREGRGHE